MSPNEYKAQTDKFYTALQERAKTEGLDCREINPPLRQPDMRYFQLGNEAYSIYNDGSNSRWKFEGRVG